jgi:hypothetical protein
MLETCIFSFLPFVSLTCEYWTLPVESRACQGGLAAPVQLCAHELVKIRRKRQFCTMICCTSFLEPSKHLVTLLPRLELVGALAIAVSDTRHSTFCKIMLLRYIEVLMLSLRAGKGCWQRGQFRRFALSTPRAACAERCAQTAQ